MPFDINGKFLRVMNWVRDSVSGIKIESDRHDEEDDNFAQGLSQCLTRDGKGKPTANFDFNNFKGINLRQANDLSDAVNLNQLVYGVNYFIDASLEVNKIKITTGYNLTQLKNGLGFYVKVSAANTASAVTLQVDNTEPVEVVNSEGKPLLEEEIPTGFVGYFVYVGDKFRLLTHKEKFFVRRKIIRISGYSSRIIVGAHATAVSGESGYTPIEKTISDLPDWLDITKENNFIEVVFSVDAGDTSGGLSASFWFDYNSADIEAAGSWGDFKNRVDHGSVNLKTPTFKLNYRITNDTDYERTYVFNINRLVAYQYSE